MIRNDERLYGFDVPKMQDAIQGAMSRGNDITKQIRQNRYVQPGNCIWKTVKIALQPFQSS